MRSGEIEGRTHADSAEVYGTQFNPKNSTSARLRVVGRPRLFTPAPWAEGRLAILAGVAAYVALLQWSYVSLIAPTWHYIGLVDEPRGDGSLPFAVGLACLPAVWMSARLSPPSSVILWLLYLLVYIPGQIIPMYTLAEGWHRIPDAALFLACFALLSALQQVPRTPVRPLRLSPSFYQVGLGVVAFGLLALMATTFGIPSDLPGLADVYDARAEYVAELESLTRVVAYVMGWSAYAIGPALIAVGVYRRSILIAALGVTVQLAVYSITGFKVALLSALVTPAIVVLISWRPQRAGVWILWLGVMVVSFIAIFESITGPGTLSSLFIRRLIVVPGWLFGLYSDFFGSNPTYKLSHSILGWLNEEPYALSPPNLISYVYTGRITSANASVWADGYANFGAPGMILFTFLLGAVMWVMDAFSANRPMPLATAVIGAAGFSMVNSGLFTALLSHGILVALLLILLMPEAEEWRKAEALPPAARRHAFRRGARARSC